MIDFRFRSLERWPHAPTKPRKRPPFGVSANRIYSDLRAELTQIGAKGVVYIEAGFPGVVIYAPETSKGPMRFASDTYTDWQANIRSISLTLTALRAVDRYGSVRDNEQYKGFAALPPPAPGEFATAQEAAAWCAEQDPHCAASVMLSTSYIWDDCYRRLAKKLHPDAGGDGAGWAKLQKAKELIEAYHGPRR